MNTNGILVAIIVLLLIAMIGIGIVGSLVLIKVNSQNKVEGVQQVMIFSGDNFRLVQNGTNNWLVEHPDVKVISITMDYCEDNSLVGAYYYSTVVYIA